MTIDLSPWMIDAILIGVAAEFVIVRMLLVRRKAQHLIGPLFFFLLSGGLLLAAVRLALTGAAGAIIALVLLFAGLAHGVVLHLIARVGAGSGRGAADR